MENENKINERQIIIIGWGEGRRIDLSKIMGEIKIFCNEEVPDMVKTIVEKLDVNQIINVSLEEMNVDPYLARIMESGFGVEDLLSIKKDDLMMIPDDKNIRREKGAKGQFERDRNNKFTKKIYGRGKK